MSKEKQNQKDVKGKYKAPLTGADKLPSMVRINQLADFLSTTPRRIVGLCKKNSISIVEAGEKKIRFVSRDQFFKRLKQGADNEQR